MQQGGLLQRAQQIRRSPTEVNSLASWQQLLEDLRAAPLSDEVRATYEEIVAVFPTAVAIWTRWAEQEMAAGNIAALKSIFSRCLLDCPHVALWGVYIRFIKKVNEPKGPGGVLEVRQAYEYTLDCIGSDIHAGPLWQDYITFLSTPKPTQPAYTTLWSTGLVGGQEEAARTAALRRAYQRAVVIPTHALEPLWKNYATFEHSVAGNKTLAERVLGEQRSRFQAARLAYRERKRRLEVVDATGLPLPPGHGGPGEAAQVRAWRAYLDYERGNPQRLEPPGLVARVGLAFDQALVVLRGYPEVWYDYARWHMEGGAGVQAAVQILTKSLAALPGCLLLAFALADAQEAQGQAEAAKQVYEDLVTQLEEAPAAAAGAVKSEPGSHPDATSNGVAAAGAAAGAPTPPPPPGDGQAQQQDEGEQQQRRPKGGPLAALPPDQQALAWIQYMRFAARSESVTAMRKVFMRACRMAPSCPWQVFVAAARSEWRRNGETDVARKIFERGLAPRPKGADLLAVAPYVAAYADFLCDIGDVTNARTLFERVLAEEANRKSQPLWERYLAFEFEFGDLPSALRLEKRARESLGELPGAGGASIRSTQLLLLRYEEQGMWPVAPQLRQHLQQLVGRGPGGSGWNAGSAGLDGRRGSKDDVAAAAGVNGALGSSGSGGLADAAVTVQDLLAGKYPPALQRFVEMLPNLAALDGPMPNIDVMLDAIINMEGVGGGGVKREHEGDEDEEAAAAALGVGGMHRDAYRARVKQRARMGSADG